MCVCVLFCGCIIGLGPAIRIYLRCAARLKAAVVLLFALKTCELFVGLQLVQPLELAFGQQYRELHSWGLFWEVVACGPVWRG